MVTRGGLRRVSGSLIWGRVHALVACFHRDLVTTVLFFDVLLLGWIVATLAGEHFVAVHLSAVATESASLHSYRITLINHRLNRVVLLICINKWVQFMLIRLVLEHFNLILR